MITMLLYVAAGFACISLGATIGLLIGGMLCAARRADEEAERFFR